MELEKKLDSLPALLAIAEKYGMDSNNFISEKNTLDNFAMMRMAIRSIHKSLNNVFPLQELAYLLANKNNLDNAVISLARDVNLQVHGKNIDFYAVSYVSDFCVNSCNYCGHSKDIDSKRRMLDENEMLLDFTQALNLGPSEICILSGEYKIINPEKLAQAIIIAKKADVHKSLDRVILNVAPLSVEEFRYIKENTAVPLQFRIFQESYDLETYEFNHPSGPKKDFSFRLHAQERALDAGFDDVGIGTLLGLNKKSNDYEILSLITHAYHLLETKGKLPYSLSVPRLQSNPGKIVDMSARVSDEDYLNYHVILRLALPYTKMIVTNRETSEMQNLLRPLINTQDLDARPGVGGNYLREKNGVHMQNNVGDSRSMIDRILEIQHQGYTALLKGL